MRFALAGFKAICREPLILLWKSELLAQAAPALEALFA
jgi:hypothetical protein